MSDSMALYHWRFKDFLGFSCLSPLDAFSCCIHTADVTRNIDFLIILGKARDNYYDPVLAAVLKVLCQSNPQAVRPIKKDRISVLAE